MHGGGNRIYGRHMIIHNGQFAKCEVIENFQEQGLVNWSSSILEDKDFPAGLQHWSVLLFTISYQESIKSKVSRSSGPYRATLIFVSIALKPKLQVCGHGAMCHVECQFSSQLAPVPIYTAW